MKPWRYPLAVLGLLALVAVVPGWVYVVDTYAAGLPTEMRFLSQLTLPALVLLYLAGWLQPRGVGA